MFEGPQDISRMSADELHSFIEECRQRAEELKRDPPKSEQQLWDEKIAARMTEREAQATQQRADAGRAAWENYDAARQPGGLFANLSPHQAATMEAELLIAHGERPPQPDAYDLAAQMVEKRFSMAFDLFEMNLPALSKRLDAIPPKDVPDRIAQVKRQLGEEVMASQGKFDGRHSSDASLAEAMALGSKEYARLVAQAKAGVEPKEWNDVGGADLISLKAFASHGRNFLNYEAALAALPKRKA